METPSDPMSSDPRLFVALDLPAVEDARATVAALGDAAESYKIGLQLLPVGGVGLARELADAGRSIFLDFKFHDIGATVEKAVRSVAGLFGDTEGLVLLTVHARPDVMAAAARGAEGSALRILGVTVLTSLDEGALRDIGYGYSAEELVLRRTDQAVAAGIHGVVSSPLEAAAVRARVPADFLVVTPGVRPAGSASGDQKRISTPADALRSGASHLVVGRPITQSPDPRAAAQDIVRAMREA